MYKSSLGYLTAKIRYEYLDHLIKKNNLLPTIFQNHMITGLIASKDKNKPIYFWQLYSILGEEPVRKLITLFYTSVFEDNDEWFSEEFKDLGSLEHHINGQTNFWIDVMGGGLRYKGGLIKLKNKHKLVKNIMTKKGAEKWMFHMKKALKVMENEFKDDRIMLCLFDFLNFFMERYSHEFDFNFYELNKSNL